MNTKRTNIDNLIDEMDAMQYHDYCIALQIVLWNLGE